MTAPRARRLRRRAAKPLLAAVLALVALVSPWESGLLPGPLEDLEGHPPAGAQTPIDTVVDGDPNDCPATPVLWSPQPDDSDFLEAPECILELPACPESPLEEGQYMRLSVPPSGLADEFRDLEMLYPDAIEYLPIPGMDRYPEFCEERIPSSHSLHSQCATITGYAVLEYDDQDSDGIAGCRLIYPITCAAGLHRSGQATCRAVQRRTWTCEDGYIPRNEFNTCYRAPTYTDEVHPACRPGAPELLVMDCEEYVAQDFIHNSADIDCGGDYATSTPAQHTDGTQAVSGAPTVTLQQNYKSGPSSAFWCAFDSRYLTVACHRTDVSPADCSTESLALCLKRASATGGCNVIAETIRCRALEAAFAQQPTVTTIEEVRAQECAPCLALPFTSIPPECQLTPETSNTVRVFTTQERILRVMGDFAYSTSTCRDVNTAEDLRSAAGDDCRARPVCADPPRGRIAWTSNHISQLAVVNSPILVQFLDIPLEFQGRDALGHRIRQDLPMRRFVDSSPRFSDASQSGLRFRTFSRIDQDTEFHQVDEIVTAECRISAVPYLDVVVEELWPDSQRDRDIITRLFGDDALAWWRDLDTTEQEQRTASRGPTLTTQIHCDLADGRACRWTPTRPGFYRLKGIGAWLLIRNRPREWVHLDPRQSRYLTWLNDLPSGLLTLTARSAVCRCAGPTHRFTMHACGTGTASEPNLSTPASRRRRRWGSQTTSAVRCSLHPTTHCCSMSTMRREPLARRGTSVLAAPAASAATSTA